MDSGNPIAVDIFADPGSRFFFHKAANLLVPLFHILRLFLNPGWIFFQYFTQNSGNLRDVCPGLFQFVGIQIHILHMNTGCQNIHIPVIDLSTQCGYRG